jgi:hypothetical protein
MMLEVPRDQIEIEVRPHLPEDLAEAAARVRQARTGAPSPATVLRPPPQRQGRPGSSICDEYTMRKRFP